MWKIQIRNFSIFVKNRRMFRSLLTFFILLFISEGILFAQKVTGKLYRIDRYESIYLPLGKISFADKLINLKVESPSQFRNTGTAFNVFTNQITKITKLQNSFRWGVLEV